MSLQGTRLSENKKRYNTEEKKMQKNRKPNKRMLTGRLAGEATPTPAPACETLRGLGTLPTAP
jgi:hypothetical protein